MQEDFIHYIWKFQYFDKKGLQTTEGQPLSISNPGIHNTNAGPDFQNSSIILDEVTWFGSVEIHINSTDWIKHQHIENQDYNKVILHVVWEHDRQVSRPDGTIIPTLALKPLTSQNLITKYENLLTVKENYPIPCAKQLPAVKEITFLNMVESAAANRIRNKAITVTKLFRRNKENWEETVYQMLASNFGFKLNADPFLQLSQALPLKIVNRHRNQLPNLEALLFGVAGFLENNLEDAYYLQLQTEYRFLRKKYDLEIKQLNQLQWKFMRSRPGGFPTVRIAQFAKFLSENNTVFSDILELQTYKEFLHYFQVIQSDYWQIHYNFNLKPKTGKLSGLGKSSIDTIIINTVIPLLTAYSNLRNELEFQDRAISILQDIEAENNKIVRIWQKLDKKPESALDSQGMIELFNNFCSLKKCLSCKIGIETLK